MKRAVRIALRAAFGASIFVFGSASSCDAGDRAGSGVCPTGEVCDSATEGLHFRGPTLAEGFWDPGDVKTLAVGGRQNVTLFEVDDAGKHVEFGLPYDAKFDGAALTIEATSGDVVTLRGELASDGLLRIVSPDSGRLYDRIQVATGSISELRLVPSITVTLDGGDSAAMLYAPGATGYVRLGSASGVLVDEDAAISGAGITQSRWDRFTVGALANGTHSLTVTAGDHAPVTLPFEVGHADTLRLVLSYGDVPRGGRELVCFGARSGDRPIHVTWAFEADGGTVVPSPFAGCTTVTAGAGDLITIRAFADGRQTSVTLPIVGSAKRETSSRAMLARRLIEANAFQPAIGDQAGERAALHR